MSTAEYASHALQWRKYFSFFRIRFLAGLQYRAAAAAGVATQFAWGAMEILLFAAFYKENPASFPMGFSQLSSYIWLQQAFLALFMVWFFDNDLFAAITSGSVAYEMCRPASVYTMWFLRCLSSRLSKAVLRCIPILLVALLLPAPYGLSLPPSWDAAVLFLLSMTLGCLVVVSFGMLVYVASFYTLSSMGIRIIVSTISEFFSGSLIPLPFLPENIRRFCSFLPFASMQNAPLRIYSGNMAGFEAYWSILLQILWLLTMTVLGRCLMARALRRVVVQGG